MPLPNALDGLINMPPEVWAALDPFIAEDALRRLEEIANIEQREFERSKLYRMFPETGLLSRHNYPKHMEFFAAGAKHQERAFIAANRIGKSFCVCYEMTCHLIQWYPDWWTGYRFDRPITAWASGEDTKAVRESLQETLLGKPGEWGTGLVPGNRLAGKPTARSGVPEAIDTAAFHSGSGISRLVFKTYDQGRESFQASKVDVIVYDEEPPISIYTEGLTRTMSTVPGQRSGIVMCAFTPLKGLSGVVLSYMPGGERKEGVL